MYKFLPILFFLYSLSSFAQNTFENGYFINDNDVKVDCLIKNMDWKDNPEEFYYKIDSTTVARLATIAEIKEFGINNISVYSRQEVLIDKSSSNINKLSTQRKAVFERDTVFLKTLISGKASLFSYQKNNLIRYFYSTNELMLSQLIYKKFLDLLQNKVGENTRYQQQLWSSMLCSAITKRTIKNVTYNNNDLIKFFKTYNKCTGAKFDITDKQNKDLFNLSIRPGYSSSSLIIKESDIFFLKTDFSRRGSYRIGLEAEFIMPFNNNKWAVIIEPSYHSYTSSDYLTKTRITATADLQYVEIPIGIRNYFFLDENSKLFINSLVSINFDLDSSIKFENNVSDSLEIFKDTNIILGAGYKFKDTYSVEFRYQLERDILKRYGTWRSSYSNFAIIFGYTLF